MIKKTKILQAISFSLLTVLFGACSSGSSESDLPPEIGGFSYSGTFKSSNGLTGGNITLDITQNEGSITGNMVIQDTLRNSCLCSSEVTGSQTGFDITIKTGDCFITDRPLVCDSPDEDTGLCPLQEFSGPAQLTLTGNQNSLNGTFIVSGDLCTAPTFSSIGFDNTGTISVTK